MMLVQTMAFGAAFYYQMDHFDDTGTPVPSDQKTYPKTSEPAMTHKEIPKGGAMLPDADPNEQVWQDLSHSLDEPINFRLTYTSGGMGKDAWCEVLAEGDIDGDGVTSSFKQRCTVDDNGEPTCGKIGETNPNE